MVLEIIWFIALLVFSFFIAKNLSVLALYINEGCKLNSHEKKGIVFLESKKNLIYFCFISVVLIIVSFLYFCEVGIVKQVFYSILSVLLLAMFFMDYNMKLLPDFFTISFLWLSLIGSVFYLTNLYPQQAILSAALVYVIFFLFNFITSKIIKKTAIGGGDIKLLAAFGALFGLFQTIYILFLASLIMIIFFVVVKVFKVKYDEELPFGIGLTITGLFCIYFGDLLQNIFLIN